MKFTAIDVETANADMASICSIGVATFEHGAVTSEWYSLIDPKDVFFGINMSIHGITPDMVRGAPTFADVAGDLAVRLGQDFVVTHTHFDRVALHQASSRWGKATFACQWLDSARVARRTWPKYAYSGYGLSNICEMIGYEFNHHNALEDAKAAGAVLLAAIAASGIDLDAWPTRIRQPLDPAHSSVGSHIRRDGDPDGPLAGEVIVFTGALSIVRSEAADMAAAIGCSVGQSVTQATTILVVGDSDIRLLNGHEKSSKHRKAEALAAGGQALRIIRETDFRELVATI